jgi:hypothetical protein
VAAKSPAAILAAARAAVAGAKSVHVVGSILADGVPVSLNVVLVAGIGGRGTVSENGLSAKLVLLHKSVYVQGTAAFYRHVGGPGAPIVFDGRWLQAPAENGEFAALASLVNLKSLFRALLGENAHLVLVGHSVVDGQRVVGVAGDAGTTVYVATTGKPYPVEVVTPGGRAVRLTGWNQSVSLAVPHDPIDVAALEHA